ncbi:MAG: amidohydrolase family protein [Bacteroidetes bacterium]|nr:amidohydrolase family protein [Bacteroidota bacterium]
MKHSVRLIAVAFVLLGSARLSARTYDCRIHDVTIVRPERRNPLEPHKDVYIHDGKIVLVTNASNQPKIHSMHLIDGSGKFLMAGLSDMHVHLPADHLDQFLALNLAAGVTTIRSMRGKPEHLALRKRLQKDSLLGPDLIVATPYFPNKKITIATLADSVAAFKQAGYDCIKVLAVPDSAYFETLMKAANAVHLPVVGHWPWQVPIERVIESGYDCIEHLQGEEEAYTADTANADRLATLLVRHHTWNCPTIDFYAIVWLQLPLAELRKRSGLDLLDQSDVEQWDSLMRAREAKRYAGSGDSLERKREKDRTYIQTKLRLVKALADRGARFLVSGADANDPFGVPGFCVWEELKWLSKAGLSNQQILTMATYNPAVYMNKTKEWGSVAVGQRANLVLLNTNPLESIDNIRDQSATFLHGEFFPKEVLTARALELRSPTR